MRLREGLRTFATPAFGSPHNFFEDLVIDSEIRDCASKPGILFLDLLSFLEWAVELRLTEKGCTELFEMQRAAIG